MGDEGMYLQRLRVFTRPLCSVSRSMTALLFLAFVFGEAPQVAAKGYSLNIIVKNGDTIGGAVITLIGGTGVSLNNARHVAFLAQIPTGLGIFTQDTVLAQSGDVIGGKTLGAILTAPSLNNVGDVAFISNITEGGEGVFTQNKLLARTGDTIGGKTLTSILNITPQLNDHGEVVFVAEFAGGRGIFTPQTLLVQTGDTIAGKIITEIVGTADLLSLNNAGEVAFAARFVGGSGIFTQHALLAQVGDTIDGRTLLGIGVPRINDSGEVVFVATYIDAGVLRDGLFTPDHLLVGSGVSTIEGRTITGFAGYDLNNAGDVAFNAGFDGTAGLIVNNTIVAELSTGIIGTGGIGTPSLNDTRDVAFEAVFQDRTRGIVLALPVPTPPPVVTIRATPATLWPPNGRLVPVTITGTITDAGGGVNASTAAYAVTDEYKLVQPSGHINLVNGSYTFTIQLQASRNSNDTDGRQYIISVSAQDNVGNTGSAATGVLVPHDQGQ
jgi:hypothetical protein